jgi:hypothetical protein
MNVCIQKFGAKSAVWGICVFSEQFPSGGRTTSSKDPPTPECSLSTHLSTLPLITFQLQRCTPLSFHFSIPSQGLL